MGDIFRSLRRLKVASEASDSGHILENVVFLELKRRGYDVYVGQSGNKEVDFVAIKAPNIVEYYQVSETIRDPATLTRELSALETITDHNPKFLLTADITPAESYNGIQKLNVLDWLLKKT